MATSAQVASHLLHHDRRVLAKLVLARLERAYSNAKNESFGVNQREWTARIETHLHTLAACIRFASPPLLVDYVRWGNHLPNTISPIPNEIGTVLRAFEEVVQLELPSEAATVIANYVKKALENDRTEIHGPSAIEVRSTLQQQFLAALLATDRTEAMRMIVQAIHAGVRIKDLYLNVLQPCQREIGRLWQTGEITVGQEHYCTAATQFVMSQLQPYFLRKKTTNKVLLASCVGEELHEVGLRIVTDLFEMEGWDTVYLGANVPAESVAKSLVDCRASVMAASTTMTHHLFALADLISVVRSHPGCQNVKILVGGYPFNIDPFLWRRVGADAGASDANEAIRVANQFFHEKERLQQAPPARNQGIKFDSYPTITLSSTSDNEDDLSRLNNELITAQRRLSKTNLELSELNEDYEAKTIALQTADRQKDEFLAMLAHELRGPLAPINHALAILDMDRVDASIVAEARDTLRRQVQQMARLINDLLDASRIAHGKIELKKERRHLTDIIERAIEIVRPLIEEKEHDLILHHSRSTIVLEADEIRLTQVIANLLTNAAKYAEKGGTIWLSSKLVGDQAVIEVRDNGIGIDSTSIAEVFTTFTQEQRAKEHSRGGLGLGLSLVKQLVELHQGTVEAQSGGVGKGCTVTVCLPALESGSSVEAADDEETDTRRPSFPRRVLIVDDSAGIAKITARLFEMLGHQSTIALDGESAIEKYQIFCPEIVVLDLILPGASGIEVARSLRALDSKDQILIVALTGADNDEQRRQATDAGFDEYLVKPVDIRDLRRLADHCKFSAFNGAN